MLENGVALGGGEQVGDRIGYGAGLPSRQAMENEGRAIGQRDGDRIAALDAVFQVGSRQPIGALVELGAPE